MARDWDYKIVVLVRVVDGDTWHMTLEKEMDFGFYLEERKRWTWRFRLVGLDVIEAKDPGGLEATVFAAGWIISGITDGVLRGQTFKTDSFGRWLIDPYRTDTGERLSTVLRDMGMEDRG